MITLPADEVNNALALGKHPAFLVRAAAPFNGGPPPDLQIREALTPTPLFFVRNHGNIPAIDPAAYRLRVGGRVARPLELSLDDLRALPQHTVVAALQCAGNRRQEMLRLRDIPGEVPWHLEAVGNAEWRGPALADLLRLAGVAPDAGHVALTGLDDVERRGAVFGFGGSIPLNKALGPEVILALEMNGEPLAPAHGAPLRLVVPGVIGARSVKWLGEITVQDEPSDNYFQSVAYRLLPPDAAEGEIGQMLGDIFVTVAIAAPPDGARLPAGLVTLRGYALGGGGSAITRVELSGDDGQSWTTAGLLAENRPWAWQLWQGTLELPPGPHTLAARAFDARGGCQPAAVAQTWNAKGYMNNAWHRVTVEAVDSSSLTT